MPNTDDQKPGTALAPLVSQGRGALSTAAETSQRAPERNPVLLYLWSLAEGDGRRTMAEALDVITGLVLGRTKPDGSIVGQFASTFALDQLDPEEVEKIGRALLARYKNLNTVKKMMSALRGVYRFAFRERLITQEHYSRALLYARIDKSKGTESARRGRLIPDEEAARLLGSCAPITTRLGRRDRVMFVLFGLGLRRAEVAQLRIASYDTEAKTLHVLGKRKKRREVPVTDTDDVLLRSWIDAELHRGSDAPLLTRLEDETAVSGSLLYARVLKIQRDAKIVKRLSPHDFRRTLASAMLDEGDISMAQQILGHASPATTAIYDRRGVSKARELMEKARRKK